ncbi:MAG: glycosyltransferase [Candidatus Tyrphobacter sp.]
MGGAHVHVFGFADLVPLSRGWRRVRRLFHHASAIYVKNEFLELVVTRYFGGVRALGRATLGMHTAIVAESARGAWKRVHDLLYGSAIYGSLASRVRAVHVVSRDGLADVAYLDRGNVGRGNAAGLHAKTTVIPNGIEAAPLLPARRGQLRLLAVGRLTYQKGFDRFKAALAGTYYRVDVIGDGDQAEALRLELGQTAIFHGAMSRGRVIGEMRSADVLLMPSRWDNQPLVLLEAMANGMFPIVQKLPQLRAQLPQELRWLAADFDEPNSVLLVLERLENIRRRPHEWELARQRLQAHALQTFPKVPLLADLVRLIMGEE